VSAANDEHRAPGLAEHALRDAAEKSRRDRASASGTDDDQVGVRGVRHGDDLVNGVAGDALEGVRDSGCLRRVCRFMEGDLRLVHVHAVGFRDMPHSARDEELVGWEDMDEGDCGALLGRQFDPHAHSLLGAGRAVCCDDDALHDYLLSDPRYGRPDGRPSGDPPLFAAGWYG
jgi:hypothetical protein